MSDAARTVSAMTKQMQQTLVPEAAHELCPRCGSDAARVADAFTLSDGDLLFDCRDCGFEWGELLRDLMS
ncbi:putative RNA-binding Zn-ribbon protein involved in translation (DUF1610 family) [Agromyces sp. PvR057]